jgi:D-glycero-D-manno-heptose 1,7-bisphosphate phosphatase
MLQTQTEKWWYQYTVDDVFVGQTPIFLDRDGVINIDIGYLSRPEDVRLVPHAATAIARFNAARRPVIIVTNQSGIGRGYYGWSDFEATQHEIQRQLSISGGHMDAAFASPFHHHGNPPYNFEEHPWRKPNPGMLLAARDLLGIDLSNAWLVGDNVSDILAAKAAGCLGGVLVGDTKTFTPSDYDLLSRNFQAEQASNLLHATKFIL